MAVIEKRLEELGIKLTNAPDPIANYVSVRRDGKTLYFSGAGPIIDGKAVIQGKLGKDLTVEQGYEAARLAAINLIASMKRELGDLDQVDCILKLFGLVASADDFYQQPAVINGASDLLAEVFGDRGKHARSAMGTSVLPLNLPLEIDMIIKIK